MYQLLRFERMYTPVLLEWLYWLGIGLCVVFAIYLFAYGTPFPVLSGLLVLVAGPIILRVASELVLTIFRLLDEVNAIKNK
ncbi:DUF4282 domain-containing protein [Bacillus sp. JCM 19041]|uniref:DUF4282 domain-containing protein n=1 Tax=Bacillus sp. JCM 19041 TaxID=1460637 RepID=UPI0006D1FD20